jgi:hypothetical protein
VNLAIIKTINYLVLYAKKIIILLKIIEWNVLIIIIFPNIIVKTMEYLIFHVVKDFPNVKFAITIKINVKNVIMDIIL